MKLQAEIGDNKHEIEIRRDGHSVKASIDGRLYDLDVSEPETSVFLFKHGGKVSEVFVSPQAEPSEPYSVHVGGYTIDVKLIDPKRLRGSGSSREQGGGAAEVRTAMPGKIVRILLEAGAEVAKGDGVLVVEAMKMQNEIKAPKAGTVKEIKVQEGSTVAAGDVLAIIG